MKTVCAAGETVLGYDVSYAQKDLHVHEKMKMAGAKFCFIKALEYRVDVMLGKHVKAARDNGMYIGLYDFFHPKLDAKMQADKLAQTVGPLGAGMFGPILDWEVADHISGPDQIKDAEAWLDEVKAVTGRDPIVYSYPFYLEPMHLPASFKNYALWIADYAGKCPRIPSPWNVWSFWQYTNSKGQLDLNLFNGSIEQLKKFVG